MSVVPGIPNTNGHSSGGFNYARRLLMPGFDLCTRRRVKLQRHWRKGPRRLLDAGSGNGWFSYLAYRSGATVTAVSAVSEEIEKAKCFYNDWLAIPHERLSFRELNFYQIESLEMTFDEIICYEALEHVKDDTRVATSFLRLLNPGGVLHLCCPNAEHPRWQAEVLDLEESGGHVRAGYTVESYQALLEPLGFEITTVEGVGGPLLSEAELVLSKTRSRFGDLLSVPLALSLFPTVWFDGTSSTCPFSLYVKAQKA
jgi:SAM-dependent methyltransferase